MQGIIEDRQHWALRFLLPEEGQIELIQNQQSCLSGFAEAGRLAIKIYTTKREEPLCLQANFSRTPAFVLIIWRGYRVELWVDGVLADEEWPIGDCFQPGPVSCVQCTMEQVGLSTTIFEPSEQGTEIGSAQYWSPEGGKVNVGDCMPFFDGKRFHLFYLKDRHGHKSKYRLGAHQFSHISTKDLEKWTIHPEAIEITHQWEGSICTGSIVYKDGLYYAFYAVRMEDRSAALLSWAVSHDCVHFTKSEQYFTLEPPYEQTSARDPCVFRDADGIYHMLVTTDVMDENVPQGHRGCLAHLTSRDLTAWQQQEPFLIPGYTDQPECADYFEWNGWYYLIYSNYGYAKYRYSRTPLGPWRKPADDLLDGFLLRVPKTAAYFDNRRIIAGFLADSLDGKSYGGAVIFRELLQAADGTLQTGFLREMLPKIAREQLCLEFKNDTLCTYHQAKTLFQLKQGSYITVKISPENMRTEFGLIIGQNSSLPYEICFKPWERCVSIHTMYQEPLTIPMIYQKTGVLNLEKTVTCEMVLQNNIIDICINGEATFVRRIEGLKEQPWKMGCFCKDGNALFEFSYPTYSSLRE